MRRLLTSRLLPAIALAGLVFWQLGALVSELQELNVCPGWTVLGECLRSMLYALFLCFPIAAFLTHAPPRSRDSRLLVTCAAVVATFLLAGLGLLVPSGPELWRTSSVVMGIALAITLIGVALAAASAHSLGANFSFGPQGRALVVRGPYRLVRHPIYLAELAMIAGVTVVNFAIGACGRSTRGGRAAAGADPSRRAAPPLNIPWIQPVRNDDPISAGSLGVVSAEAPGPERTGGSPLDGPAI